MKHYKRVISKVLRVGAIIFVTVASFIEIPPALNPSDKSALHWIQIATFLSGIFGIFIYDFWRARLKSRSEPLLFAAIFLVLLIGYEAMCSNYSVYCFGNVRYVISHADVKPSAKPDFEGWKNRNDPDIPGQLVRGYECEPLKIWEYKDLAIPYYAMLTLYFLITITFILLLIAAGDKILKHEP